MKFRACEATFSILHKCSSNWHFCSVLLSTCLVSSSMVQRDSFRDGTNQSRPGLSNKKNVHRRRERATASPSSTNDISTRIYRAHTASHKTGDKRGTAYDGLVSTTLFLQSDKQRLVCVPFASRLRGIYATPDPTCTHKSVPFDSVH